MNKFILCCFLTIFLYTGFIYCEEQASKKQTLPEVAEDSVDTMQQPVYVSELSNINDYNIFANSGWDGSWYVGYNTCWIESLNSIPAGNYKKAYIGAKIGRAKTRPKKGRPSWEKEPIPGDIYMALSSTAGWKSSQSFFLVNTTDIPLEADYENAVEGVGEARWFWREIPLSMVNLNGSNFLALWSTSEYFVSTASSPVLCGGWGSKKVNSWLNNDIKGYPPLNPESSLKTPITVFEPAIALKLIPENCTQKISVTIDNVTEGRSNTANKTFFVSVKGDEIEKVWLEIKAADSWQKVGPFVYTPPYLFTLKPDYLPEGSIFVRSSAIDIWGNIAISNTVELAVSKK
jgi:hypothetical protein